MAGDGARPLRFDRWELAGGLGDLGTFLPIAVGLAATCGLDFGVILVAAGLMHVASGWLFRQPVPVQPMKAIAAVAIAEGLTPGAIAAAGLLMGGAMTLLAVTGLIDRATRLVPESVVRGIQLGVGINLALAGVEMAGALPWLGWDSVATAALAGAALAVPWRRVPALLLVFGGGFGLLAAARPEVWAEIAWRAPTPELVSVGRDGWLVGLWQGFLPQLPLTLLNSVIAVCALSADLYPGHGLSPRRVGLSVGGMNLVCVPFGAMPMCHGAGGLAAQHRFGARTGGSVIALGGLKIAVGLLFGAGLLGLIRAYPDSVLGVMLVLAGLTLARAGRPALAKRDTAAVAGVTVAGILLANTAVGFLAGAAVAAIVALIRAWRGRRGTGSATNERDGKRNGEA